MNLNRLYDKLENDNHHGPCAMLAAIAARDSAAIRRLAEIVREHMRLGHMPFEMIQERYALVKDYYGLLPKQTIATVAANDERLGALLGAIKATDYDEIIRLGLES